MEEYKVAVPSIHNHLRSTFSKNSLLKWEIWSILIHQDFFLNPEQINLEVPNVNNFRYIKFVQSLRFKLCLLEAFWQKVFKIFSRFLVLKKRGKIFAGICCVKKGNNSNRKTGFKRFGIQYLSHFWTKNVTVKQIPLITIDLHKIRFLLSTVFPKYLQDVNHL